MSFLRRFSAFFRRDQLDRELTEEMQAHIEEQIQLNIEAGMDADAARAAAHRQFGGVAQTQERARDVRGWRWLLDFMRDLRLAARALRQSPGFTTTIIATLALGTAAVSLVAVFANAIVWSDLPHVREPERVVTIRSHPLNEPSNLIGVSAPAYLELKQRAQSFSAMAAMNYNGATVAAANGRPETRSAMSVEPGLFDILGVKPLRGRTFTPDDARHGAPPTVIISYNLWRELFHGREDIIGQSLRIELRDWTIVGVMPPQFDFPHHRDLWFPRDFEGPAWSDRNIRLAFVVARLRDGVSVEEASREMATIARAQGEAHPAEDGDYGSRVLRFWDMISAPWRHDVNQLLGVAVVLQILIAANIGGLLVSRYTRRAPLTALRAALGATRGRLMREMIAENLLLAAAGLVAGLVVAGWFKPLLVAAAANSPYPFARSFEFDFDLRVFAFTASVSLLTVLALGLLPAWRFSDTRLAERIRAGGPVIGRGTHSSRLRSVAVALQVGGTLALLVYCGLRLQDLRALNATDLGIDARGVADFRIQPVVNRSPEETARYYQRLLSELSRTPGIEAVAAGGGIPAHWEPERVPLLIEGEAVGASVQRQVVHRIVTPGILEVFRIPLLQGRDFSARDAMADNPVVLIDRTTAERFFPGHNPIGQRIAVGEIDPNELRWATVVGIVGPLRQSPHDDTPPPAVYSNWYSAPTYWALPVYVRGPGNPRDALRIAVELAQHFDPDVAINGGIFEQRIEETFWNFRRRTDVITAFAVIAFIVAVIGIHGLVAYTVSERTREIGIRQALGATPGGVVRHVAAQGVRPVLFGLGLGLALAFLLSRVIPSYTALSKTHPYDPTVYLTVPLLLFCIGALASWLPARRAAKVDPVIALRAERQ